MEEYTVKFFSPTTRCRTFDGLKFKKYTGKKASLIFLPPISSLIFLPLMAIYTSFFIIQGKTSIYKKTKSHPDPCDFGWVIDNNAALRPEKMLLSVPEH